MAIVLRCPDCGVKFRWDTKSESSWPKYCPECGAYVGIDGKPGVVMPYLKTGVAKSVDKVYRDMEAGAEQRAQMAASMLGVPVSDMADLKLTNLRDDPRSGQPAHVPVVNDVTRMMDANPGIQSFGPQLSASVRVGPDANAGLRTGHMVRQAHGETYGHHLVHDTPPLEILQRRARGG